MKISLVGPSYPFRGGISQYSMHLAHHLIKNHQIQMINFKRLYPEFLFPGKSQIDSNAVVPFAISSEDCIDSINPLTWISAANKIRKFGPEYIIFQWWHPFFALCYWNIGTYAGALTSSKNIFIGHNIKPHERNIFDTTLSRVGFSLAKYFIVHSEKDARDLKKLKPQAVVSKNVLPLFETFSKYSVSPKEAQRILRIPPGQRTVLFFGLIRPYKGLQYLIDAMSQVGRRLNLSLWVVGEFYENEQHYQQNINMLDIRDLVQLINRYVSEEEAALYFSAADLVVLPYTSATQSAIVPIAYAFEKPVITTSVGGLPEVVLDGKTGFVVPPRSGKALAQAIERFFSEQRASEFVANIRKEKQKYSWDRLVQVIEDL